MPVKPPPTWLREESRVAPHLLGLESIQGAWCWKVRPQGESRGVCPLGSQHTAWKTGAARSEKLTQMEGPVTQNCGQKLYRTGRIDEPVTSHMN
ncbi:hypothetical protein P7K49_035947 [Saguinus oedipus]|uniref:Uncharacterized protein n=1 Tax=Saguinus oedipus TaxID=9490 RepID=A0ABQ9TP29_SAGOE|nr:hypothetical protein P7K49_035947 [Saguinus oedipus]